MVISDFRSRQHDINQCSDFLKSIEQINEKAVFLTGWHLPKLEYYASEYNLGDKLFQYLATKEELDDYISDGYIVYYLPGLDKFNQQINLVLLSEYHGKRLELN